MELRAPIGGGGSAPAGGFLGMSRFQRQQYLAEQITKARGELDSSGGGSASTAVSVASGALAQIGAVLAGVAAHVVASSNDNSPNRHAVTNRNANTTTNSSAPMSAAQQYQLQQNNPAFATAAAAALGSAYVVQRLRLLLLLAEAHSRQRAHGKAFECANEAIRRCGGRQSAQAHFIAGREAYLLGNIDESVALFATAEALLMSGVPEAEAVSTVPESWAAIGVDPETAPSDARPSEAMLSGLGTSITEIEQYAANGGVAGHQSSSLNNSGSHPLIRRPPPTLVP